MTASIRLSMLTNNSNPAVPLTPATAYNLTIEKDWALRYHRHVFTAADIGTAAGQTRDASNPTVGCVVLSTQGPRIRAILADKIIRAVAAPQGDNNNFYARISSVGNNSIDAVRFKISDDGLSIYLIDTATGAPQQIVAGDILMLGYFQGNS